MFPLRALEIPEERDLAGRVAGGLYLIAATTVSALLVVPGTDTRDWGIVLVVAAIGVAWGLTCFFLIPWKRVNPLVSHLSSSMGFPLTAVAAAATGGAASPARFYLFFIVVYCSYFYPPREAIPYLVGCVLVLILPLAYDSEAVAGGLLGETLVLAPVFFMLGALIMSGKRVLLELTRRDTLTGLPNRRAFHELITECSAGQAGLETMGLLLCDLDWFKDANTRYGLPAGDRVLEEAAAAMRESVRQEDLVARLGGDEFVVVVPGADEEAMRGLAERVVAALERGDRKLGFSDYCLSASVGWAVSPRDGTDLEGLMARADAMLRGAKSGRRDRPPMGRRRTVAEPVGGS